MAKSQQTALVCMPCRQTVLAEDMNKHTAEPEHLRLLGPWRVQSVVERRMNWRCPGPLVPMQRPIAFIE